MPVPAISAAPYERAVTATRAKLDERAFAAAWTEGQRLTVDQAVAHALAEANSAYLGRQPEPGTYAAGLEAVDARSIPAR
jgi:hypothetical protein